MKTLITCRGLPGSGKSTWARLHVAAFPWFVIVNKDEIRKELRAGGWTWSHVAERRDVIPARDSHIRAALAMGHSVISDDTNLGGDHLEALAIIASLAGAQFEIRSFLDVPLEECIRRDAERDHPIGESVIRRMAKNL